MNFDFSDDQKMLKEQARKFLSEKCTPAEVRRILEGEAPYHAALWSQIAEMGWLGTAIPEAYGGLGLGYLELCVIAEEMGRSLAPVPFASTVYLFAETLLVAGSEAQKQAILPKVAEGAVIGAFGAAEGTGPLSPRLLTASFKAGKLDGRKIPVADGLIATHAIVLARTSDDASPGAFTLALVDLNGPGVTREAVRTIDPTRNHAVITFAGAPAEAVGATGEGFAIMERVFDRAAILFAFEQVGGADACLAMAKDYATNRFAFGRQIGSFQAIKHKLADMYVQNELARSNAYFGAWALSTDATELPEAAAGARISASEAFVFAGHENIQTHGGMGYTWQLDCHLYFRRARLLAAALGSPRVWKEKLVARLEMRNAA